MRGQRDEQLLLGSLYHAGDGVPPDDIEAVRWYRLAADLVSADAQFLFASKYFHGEGVPENRVFAHMWMTVGRQSNRHGSDRIRRGAARPLSPSRPHCPVPLERAREATASRMDSAQARPACVSA